MRYLPILIILIGCSTSRFIERDSVEVSRDSFSSQTEYLGITERSAGLAVTDFGDDSYSYFLRSWVDDSGEIKHQIYVDLYYMSSSWKFYERAAFEGGREASFVGISRSVETCTGHGFCAHNEVFGIGIDHEDLEQSRSGIAVKAYAQSGSELIIRSEERRVG